MLGFVGASMARADDVGTAFTYQGQLKQDGVPVNDECDLEFTLWDDPVNTDLGSRVGDPQALTRIIDDGLFTVELDFGDVFDGTALWLEIAVWCPGDQDPMTLTPRQELTPTPNAVRASTAPWSGLTDVPPQLPQACTDDDVAKWNDDDAGQWECGPDVAESVWTQDGDGDIFYTNGSVGIGTTGPFSLLEDDAPNALLPSGRDYLGCATDVATGKIYCFGGVDSTTVLDQIVEYDPGTDKTRILCAVLPSKRHSLACSARPATGKIYCFGGQDETSAYLNEIVEFDPDLADVCGPIPKMHAVLPSERYLLACATDAGTGKIYCFGGWDGSPLDEIVEYTPPPTDELVTITATLPFGRSQLSCAAHAATGKIYCFGGWSGGERLDKIIEFDPAKPDQGAFTKNATLPSGRNSLACAALPAVGKIYCFGGAVPEPSDEIVEFDPDLADVMGPIPIMDAVLPSGRFGLACTTDPAGVGIYCFGGYDGSSRLDEIFAYSSGVPATLQVGDPGDGTGAIANTWSVFSSRAFKRDISPLGRVDYQNILDKLKATDVVRYRYAGDARRTLHLGVIAEDSPAEILIPGGKAVSLGDYAAFLMAAIKGQQEVIDEQDRLIADVRARLEWVEVTLSESDAIEQEGAK